jgi:hypothetical protein
MGLIKGRLSEIRAAGRQKSSFPKFLASCRAMIGRFHNLRRSTVPDTELRIRLVTPREAFEDVERNPRPFLLINIERHPGGIPCRTNACWSGFGRIAPATS